ncbi:MAG: hypothetical protein QXW97_01760 [Candidatus Pacearchaeota archaeon]
MSEKIDIKSKKIEKRKIIAFLSLIVIIIILSIYLYSNLIDSISLFERREVECLVKVDNQIGVAVNGTALVFGVIPPGSYSTKTLHITNVHNGIAKVKIYAKGNIKNFLNVSDNNFILYPNESKELIFRAKIPLGTKYGDYSGKVIFEIRNAIVK